MIEECREEKREQEEQEMALKDADHLIRTSLTYPEDLGKNCQAEGQTEKLCIISVPFAIIKYRTLGNL